eukprot:CAMPEP_0113415892 /NCGR_PEP_ID=MMETSP0013_2-20120614/24822_1 /TAXON_ID=2843 ORGANISM="Skeletonema costatum, Strain 1716" /NCGR_SAMPLE_ID=MMETSP0013_2 /ASSEMBLY_ACC=CAM_ASM_000158 /LENGTH=1488 /DNA_ID=CAMNT_0000302905 /DNA_START=42 /DNA_END=4508 /DNA_ORIENTATION=- /assembly_acc=CAM_ASM_000158
MASMQSTTAASQASSMGIGSGSGNINSSDLALYDIPLVTSPSQASTDFEQLLHNLQSISVDPKSVRKAACCAALIETVQERRQNQNQQQQQQVVVSPNELFLATLAALTSLQGTLEQQVKHTDTDINNNNSNEVETTALPLLEILRQILPYVAHPSNNHGALLLHQFGTVSRMLRMFVALGYAYTASSSTTGTNKATSTAVATSGANALLRQILKTTTMLLLITPSSSSTTTTQEAEKEMAKLLHATIIRMFHDVRPKVRKAAFGCAMDVVIVASSSNSCSSSSSSSPVVQQRKVIADFLWEYCHAVITQYKSSSSGSKKKNDSSNSKNLIHILRLLSTSLPYADDVRIRVRFGDDCLALMGGGGEGGSGSNKGEVSMEVIRETLITLLSCLEKGEEDSDDGLLLSSMEQEVDTTKDTDKEDEEISKFAARALAFLLQHRPNAANSSFSSAGDVNVVYGRCLMGCVERMLVRANSGDEDGTLASKLLAMKLLPNVLTSILHLCDEAAEGEDGGAANSAEMCGSEFNQFVSRVMPIVTSYFNNAATSNNNLQRVAIEAVSNCIDIIRQALKIQYRNAWGNILPGGYATFTSTLALNLLEMRGAGNEANNGNSELEGKLQSWLKELVVSLLRLRDDVEKDGTARTAVEYATSTVMRGMGLELFLSLVDFTDDHVDIGDKKKESLNTESGAGLWWLLPLMKQSASADASALASSSSITTRSHLSFFQGRVLNLARRCDAASADGHRTAAEASIQKQRVVEVWSLLYYFCLHPIDMKENFAAVAKTVVKALSDHSRYPKLVPVICGSLKSLAVGVTGRAEANPSAEATEDLEVLSNVSIKILPSLFKLVETLNESQKINSADDMDTDDKSSSKEKQAIRQQNMQLVETVTDTIGQLAQICPREFLQNLFKKVVQRLLVATTENGDNTGGKASKDAQAVRMCSLLGLGQALVASGSLDNNSVSLLYRAVRPLVRSDEHDSRVQKRAYKVLAEICEKHKEFVTSEERLNEMTDLMVDSIVTCQVSARHMRLKCMAYIVQGFDSSNQAHMAVIPKIMGEVLLCLKDSNAKTREAAYQLLLEMAVARDDMTDYFKIILAALGAKTTHMRSAAVMALSRLTFEYARHDTSVQSLLPSLMQTVAFLFDDSSREVTKSVISFVRVCVAAMSFDQLEPLLPEIVGGILKYNKGRDRFRAKIKIILKKLVRLYGYDAIAPLVPEKDTRLITHMRKLTERTARRKAAGLQDGQSVVNNFDDMMESDEDDSDDGRTFMTGVTGFTKMTSMTGKSMKSAKSKSVVSGARSTMTGKSAKSTSGPRIKAELQGEILDMLDSSKMAKSVRFADANMNDNDFSDDDDGMDDMQFDNQGRIIISDGLQKVSGDKGAADDFDSEDDDENLQLKAGGGKRRRVSKFESVKVAKAERDAVNARKQSKQSKKPTSSLGSAYKSKKAGGDVKKKGQQYEPYAYVPLNAKDYSKKNRSNAVSKMGTVVRSTKRKR